MELVSRLEALEACGNASVMATSTPPGSFGSSTRNNAQTADVRAGGCIAVQLFRRRRLLLSSSNRAAWDVEVTLSVHQGPGHTSVKMCPYWTASNVTLSLLLTWQVQHLPLHLQTFVGQCLYAEAATTAESLLGSDLFSGAVQQSYQLLQTLRTAQAGKLIDPFVRWSRCSNPAV